MRTDNCLRSSNTSYYQYKFLQTLLDPNCHDPKVPWWSYEEKLSITRVAMGENNSCQSWCSLKFHSHRLLSGKCFIFFIIFPTWVFCFSLTVEGFLIVVAVKFDPNFSLGNWETRTTPAYGLRRNSAFKRGTAHKQMVCVTNQRFLNFISCCFCHWFILLTNKTVKMKPWRRRWAVRNFSLPSK